MTSATVFGRKDTRAHLGAYVRGQISDLREKSVEPIALNAGVPVRTLQEYLAQHHWDHDKARDRLQQIVRHEHAAPLPEEEPDVGVMALVADG